MLARALLWLKFASDLGQMWLLSRRDHIEENLSDEFADREWVTIATAQPVQPSQPVYGTPAHRAVRPGERFWIFVGAGSYWVYAVEQGDPAVALRGFYANPDDARLVGRFESAPGFRAKLDD